MTKHDTWVKLKPGNPYESVLDLFPESKIPMRDPFPLERVTTPGRNQVSLWIIDLERLNPTQQAAIAQLIASRHNADLDEVLAEAATVKGFSMADGWVESMECGAEGFERSKELADFFENAPQPPSAKAWQQFYNSQHERWIQGNEQPPPVNSIDDVDPRLRTPELERAFKMRQIETAIASGGYSVLDVLTGRAFTDALNIIDPENSYSLVGYDDDEFEDDEVYE